MSLIRSNDHGKSIFRQEFLRNKETGRIAKAQQDQVKVLLDTGKYEVVSPEERAEVISAEDEKIAEDQAKRMAEADAMPV